MHSRCRSVAVIFLSIATASYLLPSELFGAGQTSSGTKDPAALAALTQMVAATGWNPLNLPADAVVTGTVTPAGQSASNVTLKMKGLSEFRVDSQTAAGV